MCDDFIAVKIVIFLYTELSEALFKTQSFYLDQKIIKKGNHCF